MFSPLGSPYAVFITPTMRRCPRALRAHPYSIKTFGFGVGRLSLLVPTKVRSGTKTAAASIFLRIVSTMGGDPATFFVSRSSSNLGRSRSGSNMFMSFEIFEMARSSAFSMRLRPVRDSLSDCHEKKMVVFVIVELLMIEITPSKVPYDRCSCSVSNGLLYFTEWRMVKETIKIIYTIRRQHVPAAGRPSFDQRSKQR